MEKTVKTALIRNKRTQKKSIIEDRYRAWSSHLFKHSAKKRIKCILIYTYTYIFFPILFLQTRSPHRSRAVEPAWANTGKNTKRKNTLNQSLLEHTNALERKHNTENCQSLV